jgi:catechol 2,3-dioxygenase-like lactoylglutathione lyase family enzyme
MANSIQPVIMTADLNRLLAFYTELLGATQTSRVPEDGPAFYVGLRVGDSELGLVADAEGAAGAAGRILLSIAVEDVDSESHTSPTPMATPSTSPSQSEVIRPRPEAEDGAGRSQEARTTKAHDPTGLARTLSVQSAITSAGMVASREVPRLSESCY